MASSQPDIAADVDLTWQQKRTWQQKLVVDSSAVADLALRTAIASVVGAAMLPRVARAVTRQSASQSETASH